MNHRLLSDFHGDHGAALDKLFTQVIASLVHKELVSVRRVSQDGVRVRVSAGAGSFRREERLQKLLAESKQDVEELGRQLENSEPSAGLSTSQRAPRRRAAKEKQQRLEQAIAQLPELKQKQAEAAQKAGAWKAWAKDPRQGAAGEHQRRGSAGDEDAERGFNPACNVPLASDTESRAIVGVEVSHEGSDPAGPSEPTRGRRC